MQSEGDDMLKEKIKIRGTIVAVLRDVETGKIERHITKNVVTDKGDEYYAQMAVGETPDVDFPAGGLKLGDDDTTPTKSDADVNNYLSGTYKGVFAGYPKTNDSDPLNGYGGKDVATWRYFYDTSEANEVGIVEGAIVDDESFPTAALTHFLFDSAFDKTSKQTLTIFINHEFSGIFMV
jgi:hypothetical protein